MDKTIVILPKSGEHKYKTGDTIAIRGKVVSENEEGCSVEVTAVEKTKPAAVRKVVKGANPIRFLKNKNRKALGVEAEASEGEY